jgi:hypothetical protein
MRWAAGRMSQNVLHFLESANDRREDCQSKGSEDQEEAPLEQDKVCEHQYREASQPSIHKSQARRPEKKMALSRNLTGPARA